MFVSGPFSSTNAFKDIFLTMRNFCFELCYIAHSCNLPDVLFIGGFLQEWGNSLAPQGLCTRLPSASHQAKAPTEATSQQSLNISTRLVRVYFWKNNLVVISEAYSLIHCKLITIMYV